MGLQFGEEKQGQGEGGKEWRLGLKGHNGWELRPRAVP